MTNRFSNLSPGWRSLFFAVAIIAACGLVSWLVVVGVLDRSQWQHDEPHGHAWLRDQLDLSDAEYAAINRFEDAYRSERGQLLAEYRDRIAQLREMLTTEDDFSAEVEQAIHDLHGVHGNLQELSIRHYFDMLGVLPPEKQERLRAIAADALSEPE